MYGELRECKILDHSCGLEQCATGPRRGGTYRREQMINCDNTASAPASSTYEGQQGASVQVLPLF